MHKRRHVGTSGRLLAAFVVLIAALGVGATQGSAAQSERLLVERSIKEAEGLWHYGVFAPAMKKLEIVLSLAQQVSDPVLVARCVNLMARVSDSQGDYRLGWNYHQQALTIARRLNDQRLEGSVLADIGLGLWRQADYQRALEYCNQAVAIQEQTRDHMGQARTLGYIGRVFFKRGEYDQAVSFHLQALDIQVASGDLLGQSMTLEDLGDISQDKGSYAEAADFYRQALQLRENLKDEPGQCYLRVLIGRCYMIQGAFDEALGYFRRSLHLAEQTDDQAGRCFALYHMGIAYARQGANLKALACYRPALKLFEEFGNWREQASVLRFMGDVYRRQGKIRRVLDHCGRAVEIWQQVGDLRQAEGGYFDIGEVYESIGAYDRALEQFERSLQLGYQIQSPYLSSSLAQIGIIHAKKGNAELALDFGQRAVNHARELGSQRMEWIATYKMGTIQQLLGLKEDALQSFRESMDVIENLRAKVIAADEPKRGFLEDKQDVYADTVSLLLELGQVDEALEVAERSRARAFLDLLGSRGLMANPAGRAALGDIRRLQEEVAQYKINDSERKEGNATLSSRSRDLIAAELSPSEHGQSELPSLVLSPPARVAQFREEARMRKVTMVEYLTTRDQVIVWVIGPDGVIHSAARKINRSQLDPLCRRMRQERQRSISRRLYRLLIQPVESWLPANPAELVVIIPHGPLFLVSYAALMDRRGRYFVERHTISYAPALSILQYTAAMKDRVMRTEDSHVLIIGNPMMPRVPGRGRPLGPLPGAEEEARSIGRLFPAQRTTTLTGSQARERLVRELAPGQRIIHLATHGVISDTDPMKSFLALAPGTGEKDLGSQAESSIQQDPGSPLVDGLLTVPDVFQIDLNADIVVLSACNTGLGRITGDGIVGLSRAFIYAGTPTVMVSLWRVADIVATEQMVTFYRHYISNGGRKAAALREAQLEVLRKLQRGRLRTHSGFALPEDPVYWAPFVVIGEPL